MSAQPASSSLSEDFALYRRAVNYIAAAAIYLQDNVLLEEPLAHEHIKPRLLGHWGTVPGINLVYTALNHLIRTTDTRVLLVTGVGHGAPANLANLWVEGSLEEVNPAISRDRAGLTQLIRSFSWPKGFPSHLAPLVPGVIHEGGELGYALATSFGAAFDNPDLIVACIVGDGEAETGPTATAWHSTKFLDPVGDGAVLPVLHVNGYKIANPTIFASMDDEEVTKLFEGYGWKPLIVQGDDLDTAMAEALDEAHAEIRAIQSDARGGNPRVKPAWPMIVLRSPKGWTGIDTLGGQKITGTARSHQVPAMNAGRDPEHLAALEGWLRSYRPEELFEDGKPIDELVAMCPEGDRRMGMVPQANGGQLRKPLDLPALETYAVDVTEPGVHAAAMQQLGEYLGEVFDRNDGEKNFRMVCPDEMASNRLGAVFSHTKHAWQWPLESEEDQAVHSPQGRVMEVLSEHNCQGWLQGYILTGRHCIFPCYEAFISIIEGMVNQHAKFMKMSRDEAPWRAPVSSVNLLLSSIGWRQDHNGFSHQAPGFINSLLNKKDYIARVYLPPDANTLLWTMQHCLESTCKVNLVIASKHPLPQWLTMEQATAHCERGCSAWDWAGSDDGDEPHVVLACAGTIPTIETLATAQILAEKMPDLKVRVVNITDLFSLAHPDSHPNGLSEAEFTETFTDNRPVIFNFHGYPSAVHQLLHHRPNQERFHVRGYAEEGTTTTPFALLAMNGVDRYQLAIEAIKRSDKQLGDAMRTSSAAFAVTSFSGSSDVIDELQAALDKDLEYVVEHGNDPPAYRDWSWSNGTSS